MAGVRDTRLVACEPIGDLPGTWAEVPEASYVNGRQQLLPFTVKAPPAAR